GQPTHNEIACIRVNRFFLLDAAAHIPDEFDIQRPGKMVSDFVLRLRKVCPIGVKPVGPEMRAGFGVNELDIYPDVVAGPADAAFEYIANAKLSADLLCIYRFALVGEGRVAGDHETTGDPRHIRRQIVGYSIRKIFLVRVAREVTERQDKDRQAGG